MTDNGYPVEVGDYVKITDRTSIHFGKIGKVTLLSSGAGTNAVYVDFWVDCGLKNSYFFVDHIEKLTKPPINYVSSRRKELKEELDWITELDHHDFTESKKVSPMELKLGDKIRYKVNDLLYKRIVTGLIERQDTVEVYVQGSGSMYINKVAKVTVDVES